MTHTDTVEHLNHDRRWWRFRRLTLSKVANSLHNKDVKVTITGSREEYQQSFSLAYERYLSIGVINPQPCALWLTPFHAIEQTRVALALLKGQPSCTATIVFDSKLGLPSDDIYHAELGDLRRQGRRLAEFCSLASMPQLPARNTLFSVYRRLFRYVISQNCTDVVISIRPEHKNFYTRILLFEECGSLRTFPKFVEVKTELLRLDIAHAIKRSREVYGDFPDEINLYKFFFCEPLKGQESILSRGGMKVEDFRYFFLEQSNVWQDMSAPFKEYCHRLYGCC